MKVDDKRSDALPSPPPPAIAKALGVDNISVDWLAGDGSDRCYYRLRSPEIIGSHVLMQLSETDAESLRKDGYEWVQIADLLGKRGIFIPKVITTMPDHAALIIEDYGNEMLEGLVQTCIKEDAHQTIIRRYTECFEILSKFLAIKPNDDHPWCRRRFDAERFEWELQFFWQKYADQCAHIKISERQREHFDQDIRKLSEVISANSKYFVHRDFHSRNVLYLKQRLAVIDFQDARLGPAAYDLVSLCFDSYVPFSPRVRNELLSVGIDMIGNERGEEVREDLESLWKPVLLQRQLKAIGSFGYLTVDKGRGNYLKYVEPALKTLESQELLDSRWPFLSGELVGLLRESLPSPRGETTP
jgi:hypothetical protein